MQYPHTIPFSKISKQIRQLNLVRWLFTGLGLIAITVFYRSAKGFWPGIGLIAILVTSILYFAVSYRAISIKAADDEKQARRRLSRAFFFQALIDILIAVAATHITGGIISPIPILYILYIGMLAVVLPTKDIFVLNLTGISLYIILMSAYLQGLLQPLLPPAALDYSLPKMFLHAIVAMEVLVMGLVGLLATNHARQIHHAWAEAEDKGAFLDRLNKLTGLSLSHADLADLYQIIADNAGEVLGADGAHLTRWDEKTGMTWLAAAYGPMREKFTQIIPKPGERTLTKSLREVGVPLAVEDVCNSEYVSPEVAAEFPARSWLGIPIYSYSEKEFWGALIISRDQPHHFYQEEIRRAQQVADLVSLLISRASLYQETLERADLLREFNLHVTELTSDLKQTSLLSAIVESGRALMKAQHAALFLYDPNSHHLTCAHAIGLSDEYINGINERLKVMPGALIQEDQPFVLIPDVWQDTQTRSIQDLIMREGFHAYAVFSLQSQDGLLGALTLYWDQAHAITSEEVTIAHLFADRAGALLHSATLYAHVTELSQTDHLTNLPNRRALDLRLVDEVNRTHRFGHPFTLIMLDLDGFKSINDHFGHPVGDRVVKHIADALAGALRATDFISRYGGDEFAIILPETTKQNAVTVIERLQASLETCDLHLPDNTHPHISASIGIVGFPEDTNVPDKLIEIADQRLYIAKHSQPGTIISSDTHGGQKVISHVL